LAQASQKPDKTIDIHWIKNIFDLWPCQGTFMSKEKKWFYRQTNLTTGVLS
jgi:hypothetical protein